MASVCFFSCSVPHYQNYHTKTRELKTRKQKYSSQSTPNVVSLNAVTQVEPNDRRSANYVPSLWSFDHIQSLSSVYAGEDYKVRADTLKDTVKTMIRKVEHPLSSLELVDDLQRLGISYHFQEEIRDLLEMIYDNYYKTHDKWNEMDLNLKALGFRLMRQHGYHVPQEIFNDFKDKIQNHKPYLVKDIMGILNLYEASYHSFEDENILDDARDLTAKYLKENQGKIDDENISLLVNHALELPLHWRVPRIESKWFIQVYEKRSDINPTLSEFAMLDFDMVQAVHIEDLQHASRWWKDTKWDKELSFSRDRLVESFLWSTGFGHQPQYSLRRITMTKVISMINTIDDVYDVYGSLDELEHFTHVIDRWDLNAVEELPNYMKICFFGLYNTINEIAYNTLTDTGFLILGYLKEVWAGLCKAYLVEAKWYHSGHKPTLEEYLDNGYISITGPLIVMHANLLTYVGSTNDEILECMARLENIVRYMSVIFRMLDDLGTATDELARGDVPKSIQCYMHESGATEEEARSYIKGLILETWKKLNKERALASSLVSPEFIDYVINIPRMAQFMYGEGDGHGRPDKIKSHVSSLLFTPIQGFK